MRLSTWTTLPFCVLPISALALPTTSQNTTDVAVAGPIATDKVIHVTTELEIEYQRLEVLKAELHKLHQRVSHQEHAILQLINQDFHSCAGVTCYVQTAVRKAPDFIEFLKTHFRHQPLKICPETGPCPPKSDSEDSSNEADVPPTVNTIEDFPPPPPVEHPDHRPPPPADKPFPFPEHHDRPHHPPFPPGRPGESHGPGKDHRLPFEPPQDWRPPHGAPSDHKPWKPEGDDHPRGPPHHRPHHMPHPAPRHRHYRLILATAGFFIAFLILGVLLKALRIYLANPRVRANRAARREERRTRREYKRAACQHRFRKMVAQLLQGSKRSDEEEEEEKEAMLQTSPREQRVQVNEHIVGSNIESLRRAHEIVGQLVRAEEGRANGLGSFSSSSSSGSVAPSVVTTLPPYVLPPPRYSQEISRDMEVVDGFRYTPSNSEATPPSSASSFMFNDDDLTESSVVDCRSRMSVDTDGPPSSRKSLELAGDRYRGQFN